MADSVYGTAGFVGGVTSLAAFPGVGKLSNRDARLWYIEQESKISELIDIPGMPLEQKARLAFELRNKYRIQARDMMADRVLAEHLKINEPNLTWEQIIQMKKNKGLTGDALWQSIIDSSQKSRASVNHTLGIHNPR